MSELPPAAKAGSAASTCATSTASALDRWFRAEVMSSAILRAGGHFPLPASIAFSARRCRVAHSPTTRRLPPKPEVRSRRQSSVALRHPPTQSSSSRSNQGVRPFWRTRKTSSRSPHTIWRTRPRLSPVVRTMRLTGTPSLVMRPTVSFVCFRRWKPSYCRRSAPVSRAGSSSDAPTARRIVGMDRRTAARNATLTVSRRCQRSAT